MGLLIIRAIEHISIENCSKHGSLLASSMHELCLRLCKCLYLLQGMVVERIIHSHVVHTLHNYVVQSSFRLITGKYRCNSNICLVFFFKRPVKCLCSHITNHVIETYSIPLDRRVAFAMKSCPQHYSDHNFEHLKIFFMTYMMSFLLNQLEEGLCDRKLTK